MKTHEHAIISLCYAGGLALATRSAPSDTSIYVSALVGGQVLDLIDHPAYHLLYQRHKPEVIELRGILRKGHWREAIRYAGAIERARGFTGLALHRLPLVGTVSLLGLLAALFAPGPRWLFCAWGSLLLHMLTDICGDIWAIGHARNWSWRPRSGSATERFLAPFIRFAGCTNLYFLSILSLILVSMRWVVEGKSGIVMNGLAAGAMQGGAAWLRYVPWAAILLIFANLIVLCILARRRYLLEFGWGSTLRLEGAPRGERRQGIPGEARRRGRARLASWVLHAQLNQGRWILIVSFVIASAITAVGCFPASLQKGPWLFAIPITIALAAGGFIHTTIGEYGGVLGVIAAWFVNVALSSVGFQSPWLVEQPLILFYIVGLTWLLGLFGGVLLRGRIRMSLAATLLRIQSPGMAERSSGMDAELGWIRGSLQVAYDAAHRMFHRSPSSNFVHMDSCPSIIVSSREGMPFEGAVCRHIFAKDSYRPLAKEVDYAICGAFSEPRLPIMPRRKSAAEDPKEYGVSYSEGQYEWKALHNEKRWSIEHSFRRGGPEEGQARFGLTTAWSEFLDHCLTKATDVRTDVYIDRVSGNPNELQICLLTREVTSTKEFSTLESDVYAAEALRALEASAEDNSIRLVDHTMAWIYYPNVSFFDADLHDYSGGLPLLPSGGGRVTATDFEEINRSIHRLPPANALESTASYIAKRILVLLLEAAVGIVLTLLAQRIKL